PSARRVLAQTLIQAIQRWIQHDAVEREAMGVSQCLFERIGIRSRNRCRHRLRLSRCPRRRASTMPRLRDARPFAIEIRSSCFSHSIAFTATASARARAQGMVSCVGEIGEQMIETPVATPHALPEEHLNRYLYGGDPTERIVAVERGGPDK